MEETPQHQTEAKPKSNNALFFGLGAIIIAAGIAAVLFLGNADNQNASAQQVNEVNLALAEQLDAIAVEDLAAFIPTKKAIARTDLMFNKPDGSPTNLHDFKGKVTLINLWATWCAPCRHEMPAFDRLQNQLGSDAFEVVTINVDRGSNGLDKAKAFFDEIDLKYLALYHENDNKAFDYFTSKVGSFGLPATILVDHRGNELGKLNGAAEWDSERAQRLMQAALDARAKDLGQN